MSAILDAVNKVITTKAARDNFIAEVKSPDGKVLYNNFEELAKDFANNTPQINNVFFPNLANQIGVQFVERNLQISLPILKNHFRSNIPYGDFVNLTWNKPNTVGTYNKKLYTPADIEKAGITIYPAQIQQNEPTFFEITLGTIISEKVLEGAFTKGTIPAFNAFIADLAINLQATLELYYYPLQKKILSLIGNTGIYDNSTKKVVPWQPTKADYPNISNDTQIKLAYLANLRKNMTIPSYNYNAIGTVGQNTPTAYATTPIPITKDMLVPVAVPESRKLILYTTPRQATEFETLGYSTTYNQQFINLDKIASLEVLDIDVNGAETTEGIVKSVSPLATALSAAYTKTTYSTAYLVDKDAIQIYNRFDITKTSQWALAQNLRMKIVFGAWIIAWNDVALKIELQPITS